MDINTAYDYILYCSNDRYQSRSYIIKVPGKVSEFIARFDRLCYTHLLR
jgi:hypothetical protein